MGMETTWRRSCLAVIAITAMGCSEDDDTGGRCSAPPVPCACADGSSGTQSCVPGQDYVVCWCDGPALGGAGNAAPAPTGGGMQQNTVGQTMMGEAMSGDMMTDGGDPAQMEPQPQPQPQPVTSDDPTVPDGAHCQPTAGWDAGWAQWEHDVLTLVNEERAMGGSCGGTSFAPSAPLTSNANLRCAARLHSKDMSDRGYFDHDNPDGEDPFDRMKEAGYMGGTMGENIAMGQTSPADVVEGWMNSEGHCRNILDAGFTEIGIGYFQGPNNGWTPGHYWTQTFGGPGGWR